LLPFAVGYLALLVVIANTIWAGTALAQTTNPNYVFGRYQQTNWQERDGLPQNSVLALTTTRDGYVWLGTYEGATRFDGVRFTRFASSNTDGINNSQITALLESRNGDLWLATYGGGLSRYSGGRFTAYTTRDGLSNDFATVLVEDRTGALWIGTDGGGVNCYDGKRFSAFTVADGLPSNLIRTLVADSDGSMLVGTNDGIVRIAAGRVHPYRARADVARADVRRMARHPDGSIWVALWSGGLLRVDAGGLKAFGPSDGLTTNAAESFLVDGDGVMWVGTVDSGLFRYVGGRFEHYGPADGLPGARVANMAPAMDGGVWLGTDGGLVRFKPPRFTIYTQRNGLAADFAAGVVQGADGTVWVRSRHGLARFKDGVFRTLTAKDGLTGDPLVGLARGADGVVWIYSRSGAMRWSGDRFVRADEPAGIPWDRVMSLVHDRAGTLWLGVLDSGVVRVRHGRATHLTKHDGLADDSVLTLFEDRAGDIWVGTLRNGVTRISGDRLQSWSVRDGLAANHVKAFHQDADGTLWIGTHGGGLSRFKGGTFATISVRQGLYNDDVFRIVEDDDANLWMNCNTGIWRTSVAQLNEVADGRRRSVDSFAYGTADGMLSAEGVGANNAGWKMRDGTLWFPTTRGIVVVDPRRRDTEPPRVMIEGATLNRETVDLGTEIRLGPSQQHLEIQYTALSWSRPHAIRFRFRMAGLDRDWIDAGARRTAYYPHLPPGSYTFRVTADNGEGVWNAAGEGLKLVVLPPFHQTWWFRAAGITTVAALVWTAWRYRLRQMRRAQAAQQAFSRQLIDSQEQERKRIAAELHDSLGQNLLVVKHLATVGACSPPNEQSLKQFRDIGDTVAHTLDEVRTISYNLRPHHLDQLGLTMTIRAMVDKMADSSGVDMTSHVDDVDGVFAPADEITIYRIVQESLNNVVKHSLASEAEVAVHCNAQHVVIMIRDNGQGFSSRASQPGEPYGGGFGLKGLAQRVDMLGGVHSIESTPGRGTSIRVRIDLPARHGEVRHGG
jgi:signal transduction histidine kinase/ligand-binding sensor domain-containing protein